MKTVGHRRPPAARWCAAALALVLLSGTTFAGVTEDVAAARKHYRAGRFDKALESARSALKADATNVEAGMVAQNAQCAIDGRADLLKEIPAGAPDPLRKALTARVRGSDKALGELTGLLKETGFIRFRLDVAHALLKKGKYAPAESALKPYLDANPEDPDGLALHGVILAARKKRKDAEAVLGRALGIAPGHADATIALATIHAGRDKDQDARVALKRGLAAYPSHPGLLRAMADDQVRVGEYAHAVATLTSMVRLPTDQSLVQARLSEVHRATGDLAKAEAAAKVAHAIDPSNANALRTLGFVLQKRDDFKGAYENFRKAAKLRPDWPDIFIDLGFLLTVENKLINAERELQKALALDKKSVEANAKLGVVFYLRSRYKEAKKYLGAALKRDKQHVPANRYLGYTLLAEGKTRNAIKHFRLVSELDPKDASSVRMIGRCLYDSGKMEDAIESFREAIGRDRNDHWSYFDLGKGLERLERFGDAEAAYRKAVELDPKFVFVRRYLAELLDDILDNPEEALEHYKAFLELGGKDSDKAIRDRVKQLEEDLKDKDEDGGNSDDQDGGG